VVIVGDVIVVAGEALVDLIVGADGRLSANAGGGPYNAARTIARLGGTSAFLGRVSTDRFGQNLYGTLQADGVDLSLVVRTDQPTTLAVAELDAGGAATYHFYTEGTAAAGLLPGDLRGGLPRSARALHVGTLGLVLEPTASTLAMVVDQADPDVLVFVDPNCRPAVVADVAAYRARLRPVLERADVVKVSGDDLDFLYPETDYLVATRELVAVGPTVVLFTDGARSVRIVTDEAEVEVGVPRVQVVDTVGAGDSFGGAFLVAWLAGGRGPGDLGDGPALRDAVEAAVVVAGITCGRQGADPPRLGELGPAVAAAFSAPPAASAAGGRPAAAPAAET
jgi:fructokinase